MIGVFDHLEFDKAIPLSKMIALASLAHLNQIDKGGKPYIMHCLKVMHYVRTDDEDILAAAVGHDLLEDTNVTTDDLHRIGITARTIQAIEALTKTKDISDEKYLESIKANRIATIVKLADLRHNTDIRRLKGLREKDFARMQKYHKMYVELLSHAMNRGWLEP